LRPSILNRRALQINAFRPFVACQITLSSGRLRLLFIDCLKAFVVQNDKEDSSPPSIILSILQAANIPLYLYRNIN
jgi:hypothetical protein